MADPIPQPQNPDPPKPLAPVVLSAPDPASIANLTATLRADYAALQNDLEQAHDLAADFQRQLAGKSNEVAHFKTLLEKTQQDLARMDGHIAELRRERHRLANEAMLANGQAVEIQQLRAERDQFRRESEVLRTALVTSGEEFEVKNRRNENEIGRLRAAVDLLRSRVVNPDPIGHAACGPLPSSSGANDPAVHDRIAELAATVQRLEAMVAVRGKPVASSAPPPLPAPVRPKPTDDDKFIDISFSS